MTAYLFRSTGNVLAALYAEQQAEDRQAQFIEATEAYCESAGAARPADMQDTATSLLRDFCEGKHAANEP